MYINLKELLPTYFLASYYKYLLASYNLSTLYVMYNTL